MHSSLLAVSAVALAIERVTYAGIWRRPDVFARASRHLWPGRDPVDVVAGLFVALKLIQGAVFVAWCVVHGGGFVRASDSAALLTAGLALIAVGQVLNLGVFWRLGRSGVFYGNRLGHAVPWCRGFPFSLVRHPQYVGTVLSIWGFFVVMRCPASDWVVLPTLETIYYLLGAIAEQTPVASSVTAALGPSATAAAPPASRPRP